MTIEIKKVPVKAHNSVVKVERYHAPLRRAYEIIRDEVRDRVNSDSILQMAVKAVNNTAGLNGLIPTLLVFGVYPRMTEELAPSSSIIQRVKVIHKAIK